MDPGRNHEIWELDRLAPYEKNARTHSPEQVEQVCRSIKEWGFTTPILVDENGQIIAGHCRLMAAQKLKLKEAPVIVAKGWTDEQKRAYVIADNQLALNGGWDRSILGAELAELKLEDFDLALIGFDEFQLAGLLQVDPETGFTDKDAVPDGTPAVVQRGDVWLCGDHRVMCGDSTSADDIAKLLGGEKPHLLVTDPPYGVNYDPDWRNKAPRNRGGQIGGQAVGKVENDDRADWSEAFGLLPVDVMYVWHNGKEAGCVARSIEDNGFGIRSQIIWSKSKLAIGRGNYHWKHEPCFYAVKNGRKSHWCGDRKQSTIWQIDKPDKSETGHSTQKPVECMRRPMVNSSKEGDGVIDIFLGSGTSLIAAQTIGRRCFGMELKPEYAEISVSRWQDFTGNSATLEQTGEPYDEVKAKRCAI